MSGHTPGPWRVEPSHDGFGGELFAIGASYQWPDGHDAFVGLMFTPKMGVGPYAAHREADARIAAAAPELLAALKAVLQFDGYSIGDKAHADALAAIAKAEGRS